MNRQLHGAVRLFFARVVVLLNPGGAEMNVKPRVRCKSVGLWDGIFRHPRISSGGKLLSMIGMILACWCSVQFSFASGVPDSVPDGRTVIQWNLTGVTIFVQVAPTLGPRSGPLGSRAMAMMHVAMADAVFSIHPVYKPYAVRLYGHGNADQVAAAASAAHDVL